MATPFATGEGAAQPLAARLRLVLAALIVAVYAAFAIIAATNTHNRVVQGGAPMFYDFSAFYQAGAFANAGHAASAYDDATMVAAEQATFPGSTKRLPWNYPPMFQMLFMPLAALPYVAAWLLWSGLTFGLYALLARSFLRADQLWLWLLAPGAAVNLFVGQNGLLSTLLIGSGVLLLRRRPLLAGTLLGLMAYKPQFALLAPFALLFGREWRALAAAAASTLALSLLAIAVLGPAATIAFLHKAAQPSSIFSSSSSDWRSIPSVMILARSFGLSPTVSSALHWSVALAAAAAALWIWRKTSDGRIRAAALASATLLVTPYLRPYDLALLILPVAVLLPAGRGLPGLGQRAAILAAWLLPAALTFTPPSIQFGAIVSAVLLSLVLWRATKGHEFGGDNGPRLDGSVPGAMRLSTAAPSPD